MRLLSASALWWLLLSAPIIFFYLLKLKRKRSVVPSVLLWQRALEEMEANAPFRKLRRSLMLLLQLLALAALVLALARPLITTRALASGSTIIVIDATASMSARDEPGGRSRLDRARQLAREMIEGLGGGDRAAIIESSSRVTVRTPLTSDVAALRAAIDGVDETDAAGSLRDALRLAEEIAKAERDASIVVIGDGGGDAVTAASELSGRTAAALRFVRVGQRADNVGIITLNSRTAQGGGRRELFASIANFSDTPREVGAELKIDGRLVDARMVRIEANDRSALVFDSLPPASGLAELRIGVEDDLAADNIAYLFVVDPRRLRVGVSSDNPFLLQAVAVNPDLDAHQLGATGLADLDCIVAEGALPVGVLESDIPLLAINPPDAAGVWQGVGEGERPEITTVDRANPINSYLSYSDLHIESTMRRETASWLRPIVTAGPDGLVWAGEEKGRRVVMIGFDLTRSDLPLKVEFPILLTNAVTWLGGRDAAGGDRSVRAGQPIVLRGLSGEARVTTPAGETRETVASDGAATFADTMRVGTYAVEGAGTFAASLLSQSESDTAPADSIKTSAGEVSSQGETFDSEREIWRWIALAALAVLAFEWMAYHRRIAS